MPLSPVFTETGSYYIYIYRFFILLMHHRRTKGESYAYVKSVKAPNDLVLIVQRQCSCCALQDAEIDFVCV